MQGEFINIWITILTSFSNSTLHCVHISLSFFWFRLFCHIFLYAASIMRWPDNKCTLLLLLIPLLKTTLVTGYFSNFSTTTRITTISSHVSHRILWDCGGWTSDLLGGSWRMHPRKKMYMYVFSHYTQTLARKKWNKYSHWWSARSWSNPSHFCEGSHCAIKNNNDKIPLVKQLYSEGIWIVICSSPQSQGKATNQL